MFCESPVDIANSENNYDATTNNRSVTYECHSGYRFDDMTTTATIDCVNGQWIASDADVLFDVTHVVILKRSVLLLTLDAESSYMKGLKPAKNV